MQRLFNNSPELLPLLGLLLLSANVTGCTKSSDAPAGSGAAETASSKGVGPITEVKLEALSPSLAATGKEVFQAKCSACHKIEARHVGPALQDVTKRRQPEWIMNMILNPSEMTQKDPIAKELLAEYLTQMSFQNVSQDEARQILEFFRSNDSGKKM